VARGQKKPTEHESGQVMTSELSLQRISRALALLVTKDHGDSDRIHLLNQIGFANQEVADLLQTTPGNVAQTLYVRRKKPRKRKRKAAR
jgi:hypothetical protein